MELTILSSWYEASVLLPVKCNKSEPPTLRIPKRMGGRWGNHHGNYQSLMGLHNLSGIILWLFLAAPIRICFFNVESIVATTIDAIYISLITRALSDTLALLKKPYTHMQNTRLILQCNHARTTRLPMEEDGASSRTFLFTPIMKEWGLYIISFFH